MKDDGTRVVIANDTDVLTLLVHFKHTGGLGSGPVYMESPQHQCHVIDIDLTVQKHMSIIPKLLVAHVLSGCDTVTSYFGIGKKKVLKVLQEGRCDSIIYCLKNSYY